MPLSAWSSKITILYIQSSKNTSKTRSQNPEKHRLANAAPPRTGSKIDLDNYKAPRTPIQNTTKTCSEKRIRAPTPSSKVLVASSKNHLQNHLKSAPPNSNLPAVTSKNKLHTFKTTSNQPLKANSDTSSKPILPLKTNSKTNSRQPLQIAYIKLPVQPAYQKNSSRQRLQTKLPT